MKRYIVLFAIFITAIFFYPVFAHSVNASHFFHINPIPALTVFFVIGSGLLTAAWLTRSLGQGK